MVSFSTPDSSPVLSLPILRMKAGSSLKGVLMGEGPLYFSTHWVDRLYICPGVHCALCGSSISRALGYEGLAVLQKDGRYKMFLLEMSAVGWSRLAGLMVMEHLTYGRGHEIVLTRRYTKSPLVAEPTSELCLDRLPTFDRVRLLQACAVLYSLPPVREEESAADWALRVQPMVEKRAADAAK